VWDETAAVIEVIWVGAERKNFLLWDSTAPTTPNLARRAGYFCTTSFVIATPGQVCPPLFAKERIVQAQIISLGMVADLPVTGR
jgi:hypothetical protein